MAGINEVDFLKHAVQKGVTRHARPFAPSIGKLLVGLVAAFVVAGVALTFRVVNSASAITTTTDRGIAGFFTQVRHLVTNADRPILGEAEDRVNVLLLGMGGEGHAGAYLTDTIIVASLRPSTKEVALLSIPRDLYVPIPGYNWRKINNANAFGRESNFPGGGEALTTAVVEEVTGLDIPYYARVDFEAFRKIIDLLGGVEVAVERSFVDASYPTYNYGYQTVRFDAGAQTLNGERALQYVRSRKGSNGEGSDFARAKRQQLVLRAVKDELLSLGTLLNPNRLIEISESLGAHVRTNFEAWEALRLAQLVGDISDDRIMTKVIDNTSSGLLTAETTIDGAYILRPRSNDFSEIRQLARDLFSLGFVTEEQATIEIQNGTGIPGLAQTIADQLTAQDYRVVTVANADAQTTADTTIYDLTNGSVPHTVASLKLELDATVATLLPSFLRSDTQDDSINASLTLLPPITDLPTPQAEETVDILIVLGSDQQDRLPDALAVQ